LILNDDAHNVSGSLESALRWTLSTLFGIEKPTPPQALRMIALMLRVNLRQNGRLLEVYPAFDFVAGEMLWNLNFHQNTGLIILGSAGKVQCFPDFSYPRVFPGCCSGQNDLFVQIQLSAHDNFRQKRIYSRAARRKSKLANRAP
jgi:hypothetical protein